jgi:hypothetical protein
MTSTAIVNNLWNFCHTVRDDGIRSTISRML